MDIANLFSLSGRIGRKDYILVTGAVILVGIILAALTDAQEPPLWVSLVMLAIGLLIGLPNGFKRLHDTGRSGWWLLVNLIPIVGSLIMLVVLWVLPGDPRANQYGEPNEGTPFPSLH